MERRAILSDIHGNLEALRAVLADLRALGADDLVCLGDIVGYGPDPAACVDLVKKHCRVTLRGNHEAAVLDGASGMKEEVSLTIDWAREALEPGFLRAGKGRWNFVRNLPERYRERDQLYVHASPRDPIHEYILPADVRELPEKLRENFKRIERLAFVGHTHLPGVFTSGLVFHPPNRLPSKRPAPGEKWIVNVGSVGQPRDHDPRACYAIVTDGEDIEFRRVEYDFETTMRKIRELSPSAEPLAARLAQGV